MSFVKIFKPNPKSTGSVTTFNIGPSEKGGDLKGEVSVYISCLLQASWNAQTKRPSFKENAKNPAKNLRLKLSEFEVGGIIDALVTKTEFKGYHTHSGRSGQVQFSFTPSSTAEGVFQGFYLSMLRDGKEKFGCTINRAEIRRLLAFFDFYFKQLDSNRFKTQFAPQTQAAPAPEQAPEAAPDVPADAFAEENAAPPAPAEEDDANPFG